jgi:type VI protein secretion system component VasF
MRADFFNEAIVTAMLAASSGEGEEATASGPGGEDLTRAETLRTHLLALLDRANRAAIHAGISADLVEAADFAACAFIDELLLSSAVWRGRMDWQQKPLQFSRHGTATAGEDFYRLLDALLEQADTKAPIAPSNEVREIGVGGLAAAVGRGFASSTDGDSSDCPPSSDNLKRKMPRNEAGQPVREIAETWSPLSAVLEVFALCLAQGFTGMFYDNPGAIRERLDKIGRFVPAVNRRAEPIFFAPAEKVEKPRALWNGAGLIRRFDLLDLLLWIIPPVVTLLLYYLCRTRLDRLLQAFLQGSALP